MKLRHKNLFKVVKSLNYKMVVVAILLGSSSLLYAQDDPQANKNRIIEHTKKLVENYNQFTLIGGPTENKSRSKKAMGVFADNANIETILFINSEQGKSTNVQPTTVSYKKYVDRLHTEFPDGLYKRTSNYFIDYSGYNDSLIRIVLIETLRGTTKDGESIYSYSKMLMNMPIAGDMKIHGANLLESKVTRTYNGKESTYNYDINAGTVDPDPNPEPDPDPKPDPKPYVKPQFSYGILVSNGFNFVSQEGNFESVLKSKMSVYDLKIGPDFIYNVNESFGFGAGVYFNSFTTKKTLDAEFLSTKFKSTDQFSDDFEQRVNYTEDYVEKNQYQNVFISGIGSFSKGKMVLNISAGPIINVKATSEYSTAASYEAVYAMNGENLTYEENPEAAWHITEEAVLSNNGNAKTYFAHLNSLGYNVALDQKQSGIGDLNFNPGFHFSLNPGISLALGNRIRSIIGVEYQFSQMPNNTAFDTQQYLDNLGSIDDFTPISNNINSLSIHKIALTLKLQL